MGGAFPDAGLSRYDALSLALGEAMRRREFIAFVGVIAEWPLMARAQKTLPMCAKIVAQLSGI